MAILVHYPHIIQLIILNLDNIIPLLFLMNQIMTSLILLNASIIFIVITLLDQIINYLQIMQCWDQLFYQICFKRPSS